MRDPKLLLLIAGVCLAEIPQALAQTQIVTLATGDTNNTEVNFAVNPNQIVTLLYANGKSNAMCCTLTLTNGYGFVAIPSATRFNPGQMILTGGDEHIRLRRQV